MMIINSYRYAGGAAPGFDADYQAVLDYATAQGYTLPSAGQQILGNQLVLDLKSAGVWSKLDAFHVYATDGDSDFACIDWKTQTYNAVRVNAPLFTVNEGFTGVAAGNAWLHIPYNPTVNASALSANSAHVGSVSIERAYTITSAIMGVFGPGFVYISQNRRGAGADQVFSGTGFNGRPTSYDLKIVDRRDANTVSVFDNNTIIHDNTSNNFVSIPNADLHVLALSGTTLNVRDQQTVMFSSIGGSVWTERSDFRTAIRTYILAL